MQLDATECCDKYLVSSCCFGQTFHVAGKLLIRIFSISFIHSFVMTTTTQIQNPISFKSIEIKKVRKCPGKLQFWVAEDQSYINFLNKKFLTKLTNFFCTIFKLGFLVFKISGIFSFWENSKFKSAWRNSNIFNKWVESLKFYMINDTCILLKS